MAYKKSTIISIGSDKPLADKKRHYVNKQAFYEALVVRQHAITDALLNDTEPPKISDFIGDCISKIAENLAKTPSFSGYSFKDEMIFDAICHCIRYIDAFDIDAESKNPFSYYTQACYYMFINRINIEKEQQYIRYKSAIEFTSIELDEEISTIIDDDGSKETPEFMSSFIKDYEEKLKNRKKLKTKKTLNKKESQLLKVLFNE